MFSLLNFNCKKELKITKTEQSIVVDDKPTLAVERTKLPLQFSELTDTEIEDKLILSNYLILIMVNLKHYFNYVNINYQVVKNFYIDILDLLKMKHKIPEFYNFIDDIKIVIYGCNGCIDDIIYRIFRELKKCKNMTFLKFYHELHILPHINPTVEF